MNQRADRKRQDNLDLEFKKILCTIRRHIPSINSNAYLMQCRVWLEKLNNSNVNKVLRNLYLKELSKQIRVNKLLPPFNEAPPSGDLKKITKFLDGKNCNLQYSQSNMFGMNNRFLSSENATLNNTENWDYIEPLKSDEELDEPSVSVKSLPNQTQSNLNQKQKERNQTIDDFDKGSDSMCRGDSAYVQISESEVLSIETKSKGLANNDESWSDLTDTDVSSDPELKHVTNVKKGIDGAQNDDDNRNTLLDAAKKRLDTVLVPVKDFYPDNWSLENPLVNPNNIQLEPSLIFLRDTNYIFQDWKKTIAALQLRLSEMIQQNKELKATNQKLELQTKENDLKNRVQNDHNLKISENVHGQELTKLKDVHAKNIMQLENSFQINFDDLNKNYDEKVKRISKCCEKQLLETKKQSEELITKKDNEIGRLSEIIQDQCLRILNDVSSLKNEVSNCTCDKKVYVLKKCVSRMDKLFQKSEKEYIKQIDHLKHELELKESALQVQLKIQKAELIVQTRTGQKEEFEEILNSLEVKYIHMLEGHERQIMKMKKQDEEKIQFLIELLNKNGIAYNEIDRYKNQLYLSLFILLYQTICFKTRVDCFEVIL